MGETQYWSKKKSFTERPRGAGLEFEVFDPKAIVKNNTHPFPHEYHNCGTCKNGHFPTKLENGYVLKVKCVMQNEWISENADMIDNGCPGHARRLTRPEIC